MAVNGSRSMVVIAEDDDDDFLLTVAAMDEAGFTAEVVRVKDGEELMDFLRKRGRFGARARLPPYLLVLLDLNMPRMDGREVLQEIRKDPGLRRLPVVVLTTSSSEDDVARTYELGVNSFIHKPSSFEQFVATVKALQGYWFKTVRLPDAGVP